MPQTDIHYTLFDDQTKIEKMSRVYSVIDELSCRYGKYAVFHAASLPTKQQARHEGERGDIPQRTTEFLKGENKRQRLGLPMLHIKV